MLGCRSHCARNEIGSREDRGDAHGEANGRCETRRYPSHQQQETQHDARRTAHASKPMGYQWAGPRRSARLNKADRGWGAARRRRELALLLRNGLQLWLLVGLR